MFEKQKTVIQPQMARAVQCLLLLMLMLCTNSVTAQATSDMYDVYPLFTENSPSYPDNGDFIRKNFFTDGSLLHLYAKQLSLVDEDRGCFTHKDHMNGSYEKAGPYQAIGINDTLYLSISSLPSESGCPSLLVGYKPDEREYVLLNGLAEQGSVELAKLGKYLIALPFDPSFQSINDDSVLSESLINATAVAVTHGDSPTLSLTVDRPQNLDYIYRLDTSIPLNTHQERVDAVKIITPVTGAWDGAVISATTSGNTAGGIVHAYSFFSTDFKASSLDECNVAYMTAQSVYTAGQPSDLEIKEGNGNSEYVTLSKSEDCGSTWQTVGIPQEVERPTGDPENPIEYPFDDPDDDGDRLGQYRRYEMLDYNGRIYHRFINGDSTESKVYNTAMDNQIFDIESEFEIDSFNVYTDAIFSDMIVFDQKLIGLNNRESIFIHDTIADPAMHITKTLESRIYSSDLLEDRTLIHQAFATDDEYLYTFGVKSSNNLTTTIIYRVTASGLSQSTPPNWERIAEIPNDRVSSISYWEEGEALIVTAVGEKANVYKIDISTSLPSPLIVSLDTVGTSGNDTWIWNNITVFVMLLTSLTLKYTVSHKAIPKNNLAR